MLTKDNLSYKFNVALHLYDSRDGRTHRACGCGRRCVVKANEFEERNEHR